VHYRVSITCRHCEQAGILLFGFERLDKSFGLILNLIGKPKLPEFEITVKVYLNCVIFSLGPGSLKTSSCYVLLEFNFTSTQIGHFVMAAHGWETGSRG